MATQTFTVQTYEVTLGRRMTYLGGHYQAIILCRGGGYRMAIYFEASDSPDVDNIANLSAKWATIVVPGDQFMWYLSVLQNEKPVYAYMNEGNPAANRLYTGKEPTGEEES
jgi:hypothetical protein